MTVTRTLEFPKNPLSIASVKDFFLEFVTRVGQCLQQINVLSDWAARTECDEDNLPHYFNSDQRKVKALKEMNLLNW